MVVIVNRPHSLGVRPEKAVDFDVHSVPLGTTLAEHALAIARFLSASAVAGRCGRVLALLNWMRSKNDSIQGRKTSAYRDLTPDVYGEFLRWLKAPHSNTGKPYAASTQRTTSDQVLAFYEERASSVVGWSVRALNQMQRAKENVLKRISKAALLEREAAVIPLESFEQLALAVALEIEECRTVLAAYQAGERKRLHQLNQDLAAILWPRRIAPDPSSPASASTAFPPGRIGVTDLLRILGVSRYLYQKAYRDDAELMRRLDRRAVVGMSSSNVLSFDEAAVRRFAVELADNSARVDGAPRATDIRTFDPNPFVAFALYSVLRYGIRSEEFNVMDKADVERSEDGHHSLYVHAPDHDDDKIPVDDAFLGVLDLALEWDREARAIGRSGEVIGDGWLLVYTPLYGGQAGKALRVTTGTLNSTFLSAFYRKYHAIEVPAPDGSTRPLLHDAEDPTKPFSCDFAKLRNAFAAMLVERIADLGLVQIILRHRNLDTTLSHYGQVNKLDLSRRVSKGVSIRSVLAVEANLVASGLPNRTLVIPDARTEAAIQQGGGTPEGACTLALEAEACSDEYPPSCLECSKAVILVSSRDHIVAERDAAVDEAQMYLDLSMQRQAENRIRYATLCQAHINRIDRVLGRLPEAA